MPAGALIPLLTLGIPGEALSAVLLGVFTLNGIYPGPLLLVKEPALISTLYWSMLLINVVAFALLALLLKPFAMVVKVPTAILSVSLIIIALLLFVVLLPHLNSLRARYLARRASGTEG